MRRSFTWPQLDERPPLFVIDADDVTTAWATQELGEVPQGKGDAYWVLDGKIIERDCGYGGQADLLVAATKRLMTV